MTGLAFDMRNKAEPAVIPEFLGAVEALRAGRGLAGDTRNSRLIHSDHTQF